MKEAQAQILRARLAQLEPFVNKSEVEQEVDQRIQQLQQIIAKKKREDALDCKRTVETEKSSQRTEHGKYSSCQVTLVKPITSRRKPLSPLTDRQLLELHRSENVVYRTEECTKHLENVLCVLHSMHEADTETSWQCCPLK